MYTKELLSGIIVAAIMLIGCKEQERTFDATGVFEADEVMVSSEIPGRIVAMNLQEGDLLPEDSVVVKIDAGNIDLQKQQVEASIGALREKTYDATPQLDLLREQLRVQETQMRTLLQEKERFTRLVKADAATPKQLDDIVAQIEVLTGQMKVTKSQMKVQETNIASQNRSIMSESAPLAKRAEILKDQMDRTNIVNPMNGTVLTRYAYTGEVIGAGKALYKIADLSALHLRAYVSGDQLTGVKLGDAVDVFVDKDAKEYKPYEGKVTWISDKAEFTPKTIQTKNERANQVYAVKILVANDGYLKIGQYGEVKFRK
ncbi:MAG TPA: HlyD family efflux transporter periplasmic adaptor subunit [Phnomibacter sp.]|nr:HlyD family efflux transporter periplasmic adaptor subunit [Phnomibacter sp.]